MSLEAAIQAILLVALINQVPYSLHVALLALLVLFVTRLSCLVFHDIQRYCLTVAGDLRGTLDPFLRTWDKYRVIRANRVRTAKRVEWRKSYFAREHWLVPAYALVDNALAGGNGADPAAANADNTGDIDSDVSRSSSGLKVDKPPYRAGPTIDLLAQSDPNLVATPERPPANSDYASPTWRLPSPIIKGSFNPPPCIPFPPGFTRMPRPHPIGKTKLNSSIADWMRALEDNPGCYDALWTPPSSPSPSPPPSPDVYEYVHHYSHSGVRITSLHPKGEYPDMRTRWNALVALCRHQKEAVRHREGDGGT